MVTLVYVITKRSLIYNSQESTHVTNHPNEPILQGDIRRRALTGTVISDTQP